MIERETKLLCWREFCSRTLASTLRVLEEVGRFGGERMGACRVSRPMRLATIDAMGMCNSLEVVMETISFSRGVHSCNLIWNRFDAIGD